MSWTDRVIDVFNPEAHAHTIFHRIWSPRPPGPDFITSSVNTSVNTAASCFSHSNYSLAAQRIKEGSEIETQIYACEGYARESLPGTQGEGAVTFDLMHPWEFLLSIRAENRLSEDHSGRHNYRSLSWASSFRVLQKEKTVRRRTGGEGSSQLLVRVCPGSC